MYVLPPPPPANQPLCPTPLPKYVINSLLVPPLPPPVPVPEPVPFPPTLPVPPPPPDECEGSG